MDSGYEELEFIANRLGSPASAARLQGVLAGTLCSGATGLPAALPGLLGLEAPLAPEDRRELRDGADLVALSLRDPEFGFGPLLPEDGETLPQRAAALAQWCDAFIEGFSAGMAEGQGAELSAETEEILGDLGAIAGGLDADSLDDEDEDDERDFWQIAEFVRIAVISIFAERHGWTHSPESNF
jgi:uncharacterized protein YgfB (UPF0149 family)